MSVNIFKNGILSKIAGAVGDAVPLINNFLTNQEGKGAADANTVYVLNNKIEELNSSLTNENSESFNFGVKDGVRGFFTNPSRADDSFIPFSNNASVFAKYKAGAGTTTFNIDVSKCSKLYYSFDVNDTSKITVTCKSNTNATVSISKNTGGGTDSFKYFSGTVLPNNIDVSAYTTLNFTITGQAGCTWTFVCSDKNNIQSM